jgi:hypothetical protein
MHTIKLIDAVDKAEKCQLLLPDFQREFTYDRGKQKALISSVFTFIPLGAIMTLEEDSNNMSFREIGRKSTINPTISSSPRRVDFVLDGQQRITTLWACFTDIFHGKSLNDRNQLRDDVSKLLCNRWTIRLVPSGQEHDLFGFLSLKFSIEEIRNVRPEEIGERIDYSRSLVGNDLWAWSDGATMDFPSSHIQSQQVQDFKEKIAAKGLIPIHKVFNAKLYLRHIGKSRKFELLNFLEDVYENQNFNQCSEDQKTLLRLALEVSNENEFDAFRDSNVRVQFLENRLDDWIQDVAEYFREVSEQVLFNIRLNHSDLSKANVIFDVINQTGQKLTVFDLFCAKHPSVRVRAEVLRIIDSFPEGIGLGSEFGAEKRFLDVFMNIVRVAYHLELVRTRHTSLDVAKALKSDVFSIPQAFVAAEMVNCSKAAAEAVRFAVAELGARKLSEIPYLLQLIPLGTAFYLTKQTPASNQKALMKYVYWFGLFSGRYRELQNKISAEDVECIVTHRCFGGNNALPPSLGVGGPWWDKLLNYEGYNDEAHLISNDSDETVGEGVRKGMLQYVLAKQPSDFPRPLNSTSGPRLSSANELEIHHIIPLGTQTTIGQNTRMIRGEKGMINSPLNLTYISKESNRYIHSLHINAYISSVDTRALLDHFIPTDRLFSYSTSAQGQSTQLEQWLGKRYQLFKSDITQFLNLLSQNFR